jgi:hypothetical protein
MFPSPTTKQLQQDIHQKIVDFRQRIVVISGVIGKRSVIAKEEFSATHLWLPSPIELIQLKCFISCESLVSVTIESTSQLTRIEEEAFSESRLTAIMTPSSVEVIGRRCLFNCVVDSPHSEQV